VWPFWWQLKHSTVLRQFVDSSSALAVRPLVPFFQLLDRVLSARVSIALGFGVGILTPKIRANSCVEILGLPPVVEVFFGVSSNIPLMFWTAVLSSWYWRVASAHPWKSIGLTTLWMWATT